MRVHFVLAMASLAGLQMVATAAYADQSGLAAMHQQAIFSGRRCFTDHAHVGTGARAATKRKAIRLAAADWTAFTAFEYGSDWAQWRIARDKKKTCQASGGGYVCEVQAKPCLARVRRAAR